MGYSSPQLLAPHWVPLRESILLGAFARGCIAWRGRCLQNVDFRKPYELVMIFRSVALSWGEYELNSERTF